MTILNELLEENHSINMDDIIREGNPTLRAMADEISLPIEKEWITLGEKMLEFLRNSQDPVKSEEMGLRGGVGIAAPQLDVSKRIIAVLVPNDDLENPASLIEEILYNPKIIAHSVQKACLKDGEGCLSVDREIQGFVVRYARITVQYTNKDGETKKIKLRGYEAIVVQHEIDHLNGVMFFDHINELEPFKLEKGVLVLE
ncbi:peptide deformylase [Pilibacter termitis]|jgi:peptide deformylase|uniref:Peptide deformylase n=1 Tax=Pilibacter termitis TaxID=263852 RepID=A0A1T4PXC6_9ENTE|nr:peptide deformylase [Pilibacter termitis]SJZ95598.1 peptide deformylase [Pilibacter termitis]